jgi:hypothetical protein
MAHTGTPGYELGHQNQQTFKPEDAAVHEAMLPDYYETMAKVSEKSVPNFRELYT